VQLIVGTGDTVVPAQQSRDFQATLTAHGHAAADVELLEYPGQHMFFSDPNNIEHILANMVRIPVMRCPAVWHTQSQPRPIARIPAGAVLQPALAVNASPSCDGEGCLYAIGYAFQTLSIDKAKRRRSWLHVVF
jgi:dienelactone hydrolase